MRWHGRLPAAVASLALLTGCGTVGRADTGDAEQPSPSAVAPPTAAASTTARSTTSPPTTSTTTTSTTTTSPTTTTSTTTTSPTTTTTTTSPTTTTLPPSTVTITIPPLQPLPTLDGVVDDLARNNLAVSVSVWRDGHPLYRKSAGTRVDGQAVDHTTPFVQASVSKVLTALTVVRLAANGRLDLDAPPPWTDMWLPHDPSWETVTVRELMTHESGMPIAQNTWFDQPGPCAVPLTALLAEPPTSRRGEWTYSNGNYCALGLLIEHLTGERYDVATRRLVLDPAGVRGGHLTIDGLRGDDAPYPLGVARLDRLGAAGQWVMSTEDVAAVLSDVTRADRRRWRPPAVLTDMFGWGHTGTIDGAKSCAWVMDRGRTVLVATVAGNSPARGSQLCADVLPAAVVDLAGA